MPTKPSLLNNDSNSINNIFEEPFHAEIFYSRCQDVGDKPDIEKAKMFKESFSKINSKKHPEILNLNSMRLGVNTIMKLITILENKKFSTINLADNSISEYGMHAVKSLISSSKVSHLNLASNMISEVGLSLVLEEMIKNPYLKSLDLGVCEGSIRKNSFGIDGARCLAAILLQNKSLEVLRIEDNDIGINGAEIISIPLKRNKLIKELKISENLIKTQGAEYILTNAIGLESLDLGKNFIKSSIGPTLKKYLETNPNLKKLNLELNELTSEGVKPIFEGISHSNCHLEELNLKGNSIGNLGVSMICQTVQNYGSIDKLRVIDFSCNDLTDQAIDSLIGFLDCFQINSLNISKNSFGDDGVIDFWRQLICTSSADSLERIDLSSTKISERSFMFLLEQVNSFRNLKYIKCNENYISEKFEKVFIELLNKNESIIGLSLHGNRLSLSGLKAIKRIIDRNLKKYEEKQPSKMKSEIYNLKEKQKKIKDAQEKIDTKKKQLTALEETRNRLAQNLTKLENQERNFKSEHQQILRKKAQQIEAVLEEAKKKQESLQSSKEQKQKVADQMEEQLRKLREKRKALQYQLHVTENQGVMIEKDFQRKMKDAK